MRRRRAQPAEQDQQSAREHQEFEVPLALAREPIYPSAEQARTLPVAQRFPPGHYYSPLPDTQDLAAEPQHGRTWPAQPAETPGIDWRDEHQRAVLDEFAAQQRYELAGEPTGDPADYHTHNGQYPALDAWVLEGMLRRIRPARMIEVGSGYSSRITARVNREELGGALDFTCIEPYPPAGLTEVPDITRVRVEKVQDTPFEVFAELGEGDVLFIDSSHVVKTGSDVVWLLQEVVPRLAAGVWVHIHDMFIPGDYPEAWVLDGWGWNEIYSWRAFLAFNTTFEIEFGVHYMLLNHLGLVLDAFPRLREPGAELGGGAFWMRKVA